MGRDAAVPETVGQRIIQARLDLGAKRGRVVTQAALAKALGVTPGTVSQWESGTTRPDPYDTIPKIAVALETTAGYLMWGDDKTPTEAGVEDFTVGAVALTPAQIQRAREQAAETVRARTASESARLKRPRSNGGQ